EAKRRIEMEFAEKVASDTRLNARYGALIPKFSGLYAQTNTLEKARIYYQEIFGINIRLFQLVSRLDGLKRIFENNGESMFRQAVTRQKDWFENFLQSFYADIDTEICLELLRHMTQTRGKEFLPPELEEEQMRMQQSTHESLVEAIYQSPAISSAFPGALDSMDGAMFVRKLEKMPAYQLYLSIQRLSDTKIAPFYNAYTEEINQLKQTWVTALMEVFPDRRFWPDANGTLRVAYGQVEGYQPRDAIVYEPVTYLGGVMEKYQPGDYEFDVPARLIELY